VAGKPNVSRNPRSLRDDGDWPAQISAGPRAHRQWRKSTSGGAWADHFKLTLHGEASPVAAAQMAGWVQQHE
jgi:hypothetical protein